MKKPEQYSTERAWGVKTNRAQVEYFEKIANRLRKANEQLQKTLTSKEMYIEKLEQKIESLERFSNIVLP